MSRPARQLQPDPGPPPAQAVFDLAKALARLLAAEEDRAPDGPGRQDA